MRDRGRFAKLTEIIRQHSSPPYPVVIDVVTPDVEAVRDTFGMQ